MSRTHLGLLVVLLVAALVFHDVVTVEPAAGYDLPDVAQGATGMMTWTPSGAMLGHHGTTSHPLAAGKRVGFSARDAGSACEVLRAWTPLTDSFAVSPDISSRTLTDPADRSLGKTGWSAPPGHAARVRRALLQVYQN
jgi:hypothetical protein